MPARRCLTRLVFVMHVPPHYKHRRPYSPATLTRLFFGRPEAVATLRVGAQQSDLTMRQFPYGRPDSLVGQRQCARARHALSRLVRICIPENQNCALFDAYGIALPHQRWRSEFSVDLIWRKPVAGPEPDHRAKEQAQWDAHGGPDEQKTDYCMKRWHLRASDPIQRPDLAPRPLQTLSIYAKDSKIAIKSCT